MDSGLITDIIFNISTSSLINWGNGNFVLFLLNKLMNVNFAILHCCEWLCFVVGSNFIIN